MSTGRFVTWFAVFLAVSFLALWCGSGDIVWSSLWSSDPDSATSKLLFWQLRFPRVLTAAAVGASLAVVGTVLQTMLRNPLADPFLIGVSSASATGAVLALALGFYQGRFACASLAALATLLFLDNMAYRQQRFSDHHLLVAGVALTYLFSAITGLVIALGDPSTTRGLMFWLMGGFSDIDPLATWLSVIGLGLAAALLVRHSRELDILAAGDETAHVLGVRPHALRRRLFVICSALVGIVVATAGGIGFVGVLVPHVARFFCGVRHRDVLLLSAVGGATLTMLADTLARTILSPQEIPVGLVTALLGAPFFLFQLQRGRGL